MKYYWFVYHYLGLTKFYSEITSTEHPFEQIRKLKALNHEAKITLINFKEITKEEYDLFKKSN